MSPFYFAGPVNLDIHPGAGYLIFAIIVLLTIICLPIAFIVSALKIRSLNLGGELFDQRPSPSLVFKNYCYGLITDVFLAAIVASVFAHFVLAGSWSAATFAYTIQSTLIVICVLRLSLTALFGNTIGGLLLNAPSVKSSKLKLRFISADVVILSLAYMLTAHLSTSI